MAADVLSEQCYSGCGCVTVCVLQWLRICYLSSVTVAADVLPVVCYSGCICVI